MSRRILNKRTLKYRTQSAEEFLKRLADTRWLALATFAASSTAVLVPAALELAGAMETALARSIYTLGGVCFTGTGVFAFMAWIAKDFLDFLAQMKQDAADAVEEDPV